MQVQSYLFFEGRCDEALAFYGRVLGAETVELMRYKDAPEPCPEGAVAPGSDDKVMHAAFRVGDSLLMASDGSCSGQPSFSGIAQTLTVGDEAKAAEVFAGLEDGGTVVMPLGRTFFSPCFGMVTDRFGVMWMVIVQP
ncbi:VOC family protein [Azospirillum thermophilum]|uniref:VOC family protein n=1 Tax=Azospirillum thermophilum TaxID=2202148 RepID=A0A2S2CP26_9PROT|nr:VOC family protein [Azospirillum thermophilum]AWK86185.1 VOC family protein [Azospirillum thermophilum]